tara:strand:+ start:195 stop:503 length:309 start_codon:yes stop_codon:yes gene_type:complete
LFVVAAGYTAENLDTKGIHEVTQRRFCLVAAGAHHSPIRLARYTLVLIHLLTVVCTDHPLVSAISENAEKLQMGEISASVVLSNTHCSWCADLCVLVLTDDA